MQLKDGDKNPKVPPLSDSEVQEFFDRANGLSDEREAKALYSDWAPLHDSTIDHFGRYLVPDKLASLVAVEVADRHAPILDIACGTGLVGQALARFGFDNITGIDLSDRMIEKARAKNCYRELVAASLRNKLPFEDDSFSAILCAGAFTVGHLDASVLPGVLSLIAPGGIFTAEIEWSSWDDKMFGKVLDAALMDGVLISLNRDAGHVLSPHRLNPITIGS